MVKKRKNKNGSLTPDGRKRYGDGHDDDHNTKSRPEKTKVSSSKKSVKEMTDEELNDAVNCLRLEQQYIHLSPEKCL